MKNKIYNLKHLTLTVKKINGKMGRKIRSSKTPYRLTVKKNKREDGKKNIIFPVFPLKNFAVKKQKGLTLLSTNPFILYLLINSILRKRLFHYLYRFLK